VFNLTSVTTQGEILLSTHVEGVTKTTLFEVVDGYMGYNVILGRPWMHEMKIVPSTYHQLLIATITKKGISDNNNSRLSFTGHCCLAAEVGVSKAFSGVYHKS